MKNIKEHERQELSETHIKKFEKKTERLKNGAASVDSVLRVESGRKIGDEVSEDELTPPSVFNRNTLEQPMSGFTPEAHELSHNKEPRSRFARELHLRKYWQEPTPDTSLHTHIQQTQI